MAKDKDTVVVVSGGFDPLHSGHLNLFREAKKLGDTCLIISGAFPTYKRHRGINRKYFQDIGATSYHMASDMNDDLFPVLAKHFVFLSTFIEHSVSSSKHVQNILFR